MITSMTDRYEIRTYLPGFSAVGLKSWDEFILCDANDHFYTVPTVPLTSQHLKPFDFVLNSVGIHRDDRLAGKIKWYIQPIVFGGSPLDKKNETWITLDQHVEAVKWWNAKYCQVQGTVTKS